MTSDRDAITITTVYRELNDYKIALSGRLATIESRLSLCEPTIADVKEATSLAKQALTLVTALDENAIFSEHERKILKQQVADRDEETEDQKEFGKGLRLAIISVLVSGILGAVVFPLLAKLAGG